VPSELPRRLLNKNYVLLLQGQFLSRLGTGLTSLVMLLWIKQTTDSASLMGLLSLLSSLPAVMFGVIGGTVADRASRRKIIAYCDIMSGLALFGLVVLFVFFPGDLGILAIGVVTLSTFVAVLDSFSTPAITASIPDIVPKENMARANSLGQVTFQLAAMLGQGFGGLVYRVAGVLWAAACNGLACLYSGLTETMIRIPQNIPEQAGQWRENLSGFKKEIVSGFRYVLGVRGLNRLVLASTVSTFFSAPLILLIPYYVLDFLKLPEDWVGYLGATFAVGTFIGSVIAGVVRVGNKSRSAVVITSMIIEAIGFAVLGLVRVPSAAFALVFVGGILSGFTGVYIITIIQATTPSEMRGRTFGFIGTIAAALAPIGMGLGGMVFDWIGHDITLMYVFCGAIMTAIVILLSLGKEFREYLESDLTKNPESISQSSQSEEAAP